MSHIDIEHEHGLPNAEVKKKIERIAKQLQQRFDIEYAWEGANNLRFERAGVHGAIALSKGLVRVTAKLGLLLGALKGPIEKEIRAALDRELG